VSTPAPFPDGPVAGDGVVSDAQLKRAEAYIEEEEGAVSRFRGWLAHATTILLVAMSLFHLWAAVDIVPAQVLRPVHVGFVLLLVFLLFPIAPRYRNRLMWWDVACAALGVATIVYLLQYVFRPNVMTPDKLFGAAAGYLMLGVFWAYLYRLIGYCSPAAFAVAGQPTSLESFDALYFSMTVLTSTGFGDIAPLTREARAICMVEQIVGVLFAGILIARLAGAYSDFRKER